jgi:trigger factor
LTVTVSKDEVRSQYEDLISGYSKTLHIPGFRKGKAPKDVLERKFGDALKEEALGRIMEKTLTDIFEDESFSREDKPLPYSTPSVQDQDQSVLKLDEDLSFAVVYDALPKVTVSEWKGLQVEVPDAGVTGEDLDRELEAVRERNAIVMDKDEGLPAAKDDVVTVNYAELSDTGEVLAGTEREDFAFTLGSGYNIFNFDDEIAGMKTGETRDIEKTYPQDFSNPDLAGKTKKIRVRMSALKSKQLPELDDDLAQDVDEKYKTLEDLKADIRERLTKNLDRRLREITINKLLEKIMENTPVEVPESMIRVELESRWRNLARRFNTSTEELIKLMAASGKSYEDTISEWRPTAVKALHSRLIVETLIEDLALEASEEEVEKELETIAAETGSSMEDINKYYGQEEAREYLKEDIKERKLFDLLLAENKIKKGKKEKYLDLVKDNG